MGCNQRDFRKNDLVIDKDVLRAINNLASTFTSSSYSSNVTTDTATLDFEVTKPQEEAAKRAKKKRTERLSYSDDSDFSESDVPLSRVRNKRSRKPSTRLADSYACSDLDLDSGSGNSRVKRKQGKSPKGQTKNNIVH